MTKDNFIDEIRNKLDYIARLESERKATGEKTYLMGLIQYADPSGRFYLVEIQDDGVLNGVIAFASYGDLAKYEGYLDQLLSTKTFKIPSDENTKGQQFYEGDKVKFCIGLTLRAFHLEKR